ncbi:hypothetical protein M8C21_010741 [Ambrosia artemisiifolia]|uniref:Transmembrane protein n=1 Tax=Ambrosia artemisiifolia TaxID=4212 RepID=A0AAD5CCD3_AMBAR|nr:hypothetical protein M8C21_010741 [Ambrosia artemisiifolia]
MDIFDIHNVKVEKANAMKQYQRFRKIAKLFRLVELFLAVILISWMLIQLPFVIRLFSNYFRHLFSIIISPLFIFLIGNMIILVLVVKSGQVTENPSEYCELDNAGSDLFEVIANRVQEDDVHVHVDVPVMGQEEIVYEDKRIVSEVNINTKPITGDQFNDNKNKVGQAPNNPLPNSVPNLKVYKRSQSENMMKNESCFLNPDKLNGKLRRSVTEKVANDVVEELSNEEFQKRIEGFIARQIRFHHEEKLSIVAHKS